MYTYLSAHRKSRKATALWGSSFTCFWLSSQINPCAEVRCCLVAKKHKNSHMVIWCNGDFGSPHIFYAILNPSSFLSEFNSFLYFIPFIVSSSSYYSTLFWAPLPTRHTSSQGILYHEVLRPDVGDAIRTLLRCHNQTSRRYHEWHPNGEYFMTWYIYTPRVRQYLTS